VPGRMALALLATIAGYIVLIGYDVVSLRVQRRRLSLGRTALAAFAGFAFANSRPLAFVVGAAVRFRFHTGWGLSVGERPGGDPLQRRDLRARAPRRRRDLRSLGVRSLGAGSHETSRPAAPPQTEACPQSASLPRL
jgi:hypothetical protein